MTTPFNEAPAWVKDAVFYQIFPDRFAKSDRVFKPVHLQDWGADPTSHGFQGGDLLGIAENLDYLADLGINALYLNPIFVSGANHRYHTDDYYQVDPLLGGNEALDEMIAACHERGIRVVLDGVFNHVGRGFHQFHNIVENREESPYLDWFTIDQLPLEPYGDGPAGYLGWYNLKPLPRLDTDNPVVRDYVMKVAEHWLHKGIDGWRLDVPIEITADGFWEEFRERVRAVNPDAYIVGEIWEDSSEYIVGGTRFDATMNYLLTVEVLSFVAGERIDPPHVVPNPAYASVAPIDATTYAERIDTLFARYPMATHLANLNLLESHDTARFLTTASEDNASLILATLLTMTFPGAPCVYYGSEVGLTGSLDPECRRAFPWDESDWDMELLTAHRELIALRHAHPALRAPGYRHLSAANHLYVFERSAPGEQLIVAVNAGDEPASAQVAGELDLLWGDGEAAGGALTLPARAGAVWAAR
ncbi:MAG: glycoside hydrolase family 13 protein [Acidimicrobiia bacterium]|nr:glycoside hydrolase family 13 protein [Acidimicrobiia bacterium]